MVSNAFNIKRCCNIVMPGSVLLSVLSTLRLGYSSRGHPGANTSVIKYNGAQRRGNNSAPLYNNIQTERDFMGWT